MSVSSDILLASLLLCDEIQNIQVVSNKAIMFSFCLWMSVLVPFVSCNSLSLRPS